MKFPFALSLVTFAIVMMVGLLQWTIIDLITPFLFLPLLGVVAMFFLGSLVVACRYWATASSAATSWPLRLAPALPTLIHGLALAAVVFFPFTRVWLTVNFHLHKAQRQAVVEKVYRQELQANERDMVAVPPGYGYLSAGGNQLMVRPAEPQPYVFFFTYRGILDNFSGFVYAPGELSPEEFGAIRSEEFFEIQPMAAGWYFVAHR